ncbi:hypothetical protein HK098_004750 [Nowakowskiella sp. JEL0407]|nr:hypothetical protein HK098_004750 [Nowakowskiella sp. JEL0407]
MFRRKVFSLHYYVNNDPRNDLLSINVFVKSKLSYPDLLQLVLSHGSPFCKYNSEDVCFRISLANDLQPSPIKLRFDDKINEILKSNRIWVVTKLNIPLLMFKKSGDVCTVVVKLWEEDFIPENVFLSVEQIFGCDRSDYQIYAIHPDRDDIKIYVGLDTKLRFLVCKKKFFLHLHMNVDDSSSTAAVSTIYEASKDQISDTGSMYSDIESVEQLETINSSPSTVNASITAPKLHEKIIEIAVRDGYLDDFYNSTFRIIFTKFPIPHMLDFLALIVVAFEPLTVTSFSEIIQIPPETTLKIISALDPVLYITFDDHVTFVHNSIPEFLVDPRRCNNPRFAVLTKKWHSKVFGYCLTALNNHLKFNMTELPQHTLHSEIPDFDQNVLRRIPQHLRYPGLYFWKHHEHSDGYNGGGVLDNVYTIFICEKFLHWIELLSLLKSLHTIKSGVCVLLIDLVMLAINQSNSRNIGRYFTSGKEDVLEKRKIDVSIEILHDVELFMKNFGHVISACALQVYITAIPFAPRNTWIYNNYIHSLPLKQVPRVLSGSDERWSNCLSTLEGHSSPVNSVAISPDGKYVASASVYHSRDVCRIWSMETGKLVKELKGVASPIIFSKNSRFLFSGSSDYAIKSWYFETGVELGTYCGHFDKVSALTLSQGQYLVSGSLDWTIRVWKINRHQATWKRTLKGHNAAVTSVDISQSGLVLVSASMDKTIKVWSFYSGILMRTLTGHEGPVLSVKISPAEKIVVSGSRDRTVRTWWIEDGIERSIMLSHSSVVKTIAISQDGQKVISGSNDNSIKMWDMDSGEEILTLKGHKKEVNSVQFFNNDTCIVSGSADRTMKFWGLDSSLSSSKPKQAGGHILTVTCVIFSNDGEYVFTASSDKTIKVWSLKSGKEERTLVTENVITKMEVSNDGQYLFAGGWSKMITMWEIKTGDCISVVYEFRSAINELWMSKDGRFVVSKGINDEECVVWDIAESKKLTEVAPGRIEKRRPYVDYMHTLTGIGEFSEWDGWVTVDNKKLCWIPHNFRWEVVAEMYKW